MKHHNKSAFTLAEVLITLGIIGVVAAMTLPTMINNSQNKQLQVGLKKAYSTLNQALMMYYSENGEYIKPDLEAGRLKPILLKYIAMAKDCGIGSTDADKACRPNKAYVSDKDSYKDIYYNFNGKSAMEYALFDDGQFVMNDTMFVMIENSYLKQFDYMTPQLYISVDVNGMNKKPNRLGQDVFMFQITNEGKLLPMGAEGTDFPDKVNKNCSLTSSWGMNGSGCTAKALTDENFFKKLPK